MSALAPAGRRKQVSLSARSLCGFALIEVAIAMTLASVAMTGLVASGQLVIRRSAETLDAQFRLTEARNRAESLDGCAFGPAGGCRGHGDLRLAGAPLGCLLISSEPPENRSAPAAPIVAGCRL